jgi:single-stranded DNA-binding protein
MPSCKPVSNLRLANDRTVKGEEETQFHTIVCWDRLAETTAEYVKKGAQLASPESTRPTR